MKQLFFLFGLLFFVNESHAWGPEGHKVVAQVAQKLLTQKAQAGVAKLLGTQSMADVANWADEIRSDPHWDFAKPWHFINIEDNQTYENAPHAPAGDLVTAITAQVRVLKNPAAPIGDKENALKFLIHFVGDIHQPLHVGRGGDFGGNSIKVIFEGRNLNLHSVWDSGMIDLERTDYVAYANHLGAAALRLRVAPFDIREIAFNQIIIEDMNVRRQIYNFRPSANGVVVLDQNYMNANINLLHDRLLLGGKRLSSLLNQIFL